MAESIQKGGKMNEEDEGQIGSGEVPPQMPYLRTALCFSCHFSGSLNSARISRLVFFFGGGAGSSSSLSSSESSSGSAYSLGGVPEVDQKGVYC